jgi:F-type H+-transporting ATPase subunit b
MTIDWWTLGLQTVNVVVLIWILARFLFRPVSKIIAERQKAARAALDEAEVARDDAKAARDAAQAETEAVTARRVELVAKAREEAQSEKQRLLDDARVVVAKTRAEGRAGLEQRRAAEQRAFAEQAGVLATDIAGRLLARLPESARVVGFIDGLAEAVADLPKASREAIGADGTIRLRAARALEETERAQLEARLAEVLDRPLVFEFKTDPDLIAGLELDTPHAIVRNHFRADLDRIQAELTGHG